MQDVNDIPPVFTSVPRPVTLDDDVPIGTTVINLIAADSDGTAPGNQVNITLNSYPTPEAISVLTSMFVLLTHRSKMPYKSTKSTLHEMFQVRYEITGRGIASKYFIIDSDTGVLRVRDDLRKETDTEYQVHKDFHKFSNSRFWIDEILQI